jgi:hypothetical protein
MAQSFGIGANMTQGSAVWRRKLRVAASKMPVTTFVITYAWRDDGAMAVNRSDCPRDPEDAAERYCLNTLQQVDRLAFEQHVRHCQPCARVLRETEVYVKAMQAAAKEIRDREKSS